MGASAPIFRMVCQKCHLLWAEFSTTGIRISVTNCSRSLVSQ